MVIEVIPTTELHVRSSVGTSAYILFFTIANYYHYPALTFNPGKSIRKERRMVKVLAPAESM